MENNDNKTNKLSNAIKNIDIAYVYVILSILAGVFVVHMFTGQWCKSSNPYNSFALQAKSWLEGRLDLGQNYPHLELAIFDNKYFVSFPPFVSYVLLPFTLLFGTNTPDNYIAVICYMVSAVYAVKLFRLIRGTYENSCLFAILLLLASNVLFCSVNGWVWFIAQNFAFTLSLMSIYYAASGKLGLSLSFLACAVGCRPFQFVYLPLILCVFYMEWSKGFDAKDQSNKLIKLIKEKWTCALAPLAIGVSYMILNYARFGNIFEFGHNYLPEFVDAPNGQFSSVYISENLSSLWKMPTAADNGAWVFPQFNGVAIWLVSPIFITFVCYYIYSAVSRRSLEADLSKEDKKRNLIVRITLPVLLIIHVLCIVSHRTMGGWHFGNRYINDLLPFVYYGILLFTPKKDSLLKLNIPLCVYGIAVNVIGTISTYNNWSF